MPNTATLENGIGAAQFRNLRDAPAANRHVARIPRRARPVDDMTVADHDVIRLGAGQSDQERRDKQFWPPINAD